MSPLRIYISIIFWHVDSTLQKNLWLINCVYYISCENRFSSVWSWYSYVHTFFPKIMVDVALLHIVPIYRINRKRQLMLILYPILYCYYDFVYIKVHRDHTQLEKIMIFLCICFRTQSWFSSRRARASSGCANSSQPTKALQRFCLYALLLLLLFHIFES